MDHELAELPVSIRDRIVRLGIPHPERFVSVVFPSLGNRSIMDALAERHGEDAVLSLLARIEGYLGR